MARIPAALVLLICLATPGLSQQLLAEYNTTLWPEDARNSKGRPLGDVCAIVQQDRANFHRFGIRHPGDESDPVFGSQHARARIAGNCRYSRDWIERYIRDTLLGRGEPVYIWVRIYGRGGQPAYLVIQEGAG